MDFIKELSLVLSRLIKNDEVKIKGENHKEIGEGVVGVINEYCITPPRIVHLKNETIIQINIEE